MTPIATAVIVFSPGPLGLELEPLSRAGGRAVGCRVTGFKRLPDGRVGQAELVGSTGPGDILVEVDGVVVSDMSFDKIIATLLNKANRPERHLTFRSTTTTTAATTAAKESPGTAPLSPRARGQRASLNFPAGSGNTATIASTGGSTQPATPSPGSQPRPPGERDGFSAERTPGFDGSEEEQQRQHQERRRERVMGFLGMGDGGGRAGEMGVTAGTSSGAGGGNNDNSSGGEKVDGEWWRGAQQVEIEETPEGAERASSEDRDVPATAAAAGAAARGFRPEREERYSSRGVAQLFLEGGPQSAADGFQGTAVAPTSPASSKAERGDQGSQKQNIGPRASSLSGGVARAPDDQVQLDSIGSSRAWSTAIHAAVASGGFASGRSGARPAAEKETDPLKTAAAAAVSSVGPYYVVANRLSAGSTVLDGGQMERRRSGGADTHGDADEHQLPRGGSPETVARSLDTVSLLSEPAVNSKDAKQRVSMLASLWGGGGGGGDQVEDSQGNGESELEGARRLARSLAVKLKERARRCEELEDLFGLRDHQVSQLQRQSNSLAARAASLADDLADKSSMVEALQQDRARLERELAQSRAQSKPRRDQGEHDAGGREEAPGAAARPAAFASPGSGEDGSPLPRLGGRSGEATTGEAGAAASAAAAAAGTAIEAPGAAETLAAVVEAAERKAGEAVAAADARCLALTEMVDSLVADKVAWEEERAAAAMETMRLRARVRGLEEVAVDWGAGDEYDGGEGDRKQTVLVEELRKLLRERTREVEVKIVAMERLEAHARELEEEKRRLTVSLSAREEDLLLSDRQMQALSARLKGEARASGESAARAEAVAGELRKALEEATTGVTAAAAAAAAAGATDRVGGKEGEEEAGNPPSPPPSVWDRAAWAEERARLHHNLLSLREALQDREVQAEADEAALSSRLEAAQDEGERSARESASLRETVDSLRVELAEALVAAATAVGPGRHEDGGASVGWGEGEGGQHARPASGEASSGSIAGSKEGEEPRREEETGGGGNGGVVPMGGGRSEDGVEKGVEETGPETKGSSVREPENGGRLAATVAEERKREAEGAGGKHRRVGSSGDGALATGTRDRWLDGGFEGSVDDLQLDLMEKDIVIEQLRNQLKQLRSKLAVIEEEQAADTAPLQGLLNQLGELKGSVEEREQREQQCRDQVDLGLMRMERLKEENAAATATATAAVTSPPVSFAGSAAASPPFLAQADPSRGQAQVELQRLRRQLEDLQWDLRTAKRRVEERDTQLRDARSGGERLQKRARDAERDLGTAQSELAIAAAEVAAQRRRSGVLRAELQALRAELQCARERAQSTAAAAAKSSAEDRDSASAAVAEAEVVSDRVASLSASLRAVTLERDNLLAAKQAVAVASFGVRVEEEAARTRELESMRCALAARDVELESIVDASSGFSLGGGGAGGGGGGGGGGKGGSGHALRCALAAVSEARRAQCLVAELREEAASLRARVEEGQAETARLRAALEQAKLAEKKSAMAATAAAASAAATAAAGQSNDASREKGGYSPAEARAAAKRAQDAEDALQKTLMGAQRAWGVVSSCLADESREDEDDVFGATANPPPPPPPLVAALHLWQQPATSTLPSLPSADASLGALVSGVETLAAAYRRRGHAVRRATVAARAKTVCSREARRREEAEARAREEAEGRLQEALVALDHCQRHHLQQQQQPQPQPQPTSWRVLPAGEWATAATAGREDARPTLSKDQEEHLRQIRSEVDRLEDQNRTLRRSLEGGDAPGAGPVPDRLRGKTTEIRVREGRGREAENGVGVPTQRLLFPPSSGATAGKEREGRGRSKTRADCWEGVERLGGSGSGGQARTPSPSPVRSWVAVSNTHGGGGAWPPQGGGAEDGQGRSGCREKEDDDDDARARVLEECAGYCVPPQEDGSGGTLVPAWSRNA
eukprot:g13643.t1